MDAEGSSGRQLVKKILAARKLALHEKPPVQTWGPRIQRDESFLRLEATYDHVISRIEASERLHPICLFSIYRLAEQCLVLLALLDHSFENSV
jgi:hypothetical protein